MRKAKEKRSICDPVLKQPSPTTCGPAAVRMIIGTYGKGAPSLEDVCKAVPGTFTKEKGTEIKDTPKILEHYGIDSKVERSRRSRRSRRRPRAASRRLPSSIRAGRSTPSSSIRVIDNGDGTKDVTGRDPLTGDRFHDAVEGVRRLVAIEADDHHVAEVTISVRATPRGSRFAA